VKITIFAPKYSETWFKTSQDARFIQQYDWLVSIKEKCWCIDKRF